VLIPQKEYRGKKMSSSTERKKMQREKDRQKGVKEVSLRVHVMDETSVKAYANFLLQRRLKHE
tara:strand:- start:990 stop:1178 length:189 start_codon:yes stop_codon:yes gene_type:complete